ncbi:MAG: DUF2927 domain-containing protein [Pseudomonadota bacterium]
MSQPFEKARLFRKILMVMAIGLLAGCNVSGLIALGREQPVERQLPGVPQPTSVESAVLRQYLMQVQNAQLSQGLLRRDGGGVDTPFTPMQLAQNFEQIAFYSEYSNTFSGIGGRSPLRRWDTPVRIGVVFGAGVSADQRSKDRAHIAAYAERLSRVTGHSILFRGQPNFAVVIASEDDRSDALAKAAAAVEGVSTDSLDAFRDLGRDTYCAVAAFHGGSDPNTHTAAVALIRSENPDLLRLSCIHEELAQGMGLANDSPRARPSIFNDDDEFALLTYHDELLLRLLYDLRLRPGMLAAEAAPLAQIIAQELMSNAL